MTGPTHMTPESSRERDLALCRSLLYEALSLGFRLPTQHTCERQTDASALAEAAAFIDSHQKTDLARPTLRLAADQIDNTPASLLTAYERLYGHTVRGPIPPYETEYGDDTMFQKPHEMSDIAAFLRAFGLASPPSA